MKHRYTPTHEEIAVAAYFIWQENGEVEGEDWRNWFQAELRLRMGKEHWGLKSARQSLRGNGCESPDARNQTE